MSWSLFNQTASATIANTTTETTLVGAGLGNLTIPANFFVVGRTLKLKMTGTKGTTLTPTMQLRCKYGSTMLIDSTALALITLVGTQSWEVLVELTCRSTGGSGSLQANMAYKFSAATGVAAANLFTVAPNTPTVDTTASGLLDLMITWGTASASNTITSTTCTVEVL